VYISLSIRSGNFWIHHRTSPMQNVCCQIGMTYCVSVITTEAISRNGKRCRDDSLTWNKRKKMQVKTILANNYKRKEIQVTREWWWLCHFAHWDI